MSFRRKAFFFLLWVIAVSVMVYFSMQKATWLAQEEARLRQTPFQAIFHPTALDPEAGEHVLQARDAAQDLMTLLGQQLKGSIEANGPAAAVGVCGSVAQSLTNEYAVKHGIGIRRTALRMKSTKNSPDSFEKAWMDSQSIFDAKTPAPDHGEIVTREDGSKVYRYITPIYMKEMCLACHGNPATFQTGVKAYLAKHYPLDQATGFSVGDFRGAVSVQVPIP
ncbi:MAG: DUF3365 domain-containing protein [Planctomycetota bacterium]|nr:DUF3365 domain-containing protein [Planctomycetota bacterium]